MAVLEYGVSVAEASPREIVGDFERQADLQEEAEARGLETEVEREGSEVRVLVKGGAGALVSLAAWALGRDTWPDELRVAPDE